MKANGINIKPRYQRSTEIAITAVAVIIGLVFILPFVIMVLGSFSANTVMSKSLFFWIPKEFSLQNYEQLLARDSFLMWLVNSALYTAFPTVIIMASSLFLGYIFAKRKFPGRDFIFWLFLGMIMVPTQVLAVPRYSLFSQLNWIDTRGIMIVPFLWDIASLFFMRQYMQSIPDEIEEAAVIDGCGQFRCVLSIIAPMCGPALASIAILSFVARWNDFFYPLIFVTSESKYPITVGLSSIMTEAPQFGFTMASAVISFLPTFLIYVCMQKYFIEGVSTSGLKG